MGNARRRGSRQKRGERMMHARARLLSMGNGGKNSNSSQFFVTLNAASKCNGKHVIFGEVISRMVLLVLMDNPVVVGDGDYDYNNDDNADNHMLHHTQNN